jgi:ABC-type bacteriocin/lantibiotic exporters, contain an N-terminal double-glycine peptidase domain
MLPLLIMHKGRLKAVLSNFKGNCYYTENGIRIYITEKNASEFETSAVCFYKGFETEKISQLSLLKYMFSCIHSREYVVIFFAMILATLFATVMPQAQYYIFNYLIPAGTTNDIMPISLLLSGIIIMTLVVNMFKGIVTANMPLTISANLQGAMLSRLLSLKPRFFVGAKSGGLSRMIIKISEVSDIISADTIAALLSFLLSFIYAVEIKLYAPEFMAFVWLAFAAVLIMTVINAVMLKRYTSEYYDKAKEMTGFVYEVFGGMENVKLSNSSSVMFRRWSKYYADTLKARKKPFFAKYYSAIYTLVITLFTALIFVAGIMAKTTAADFIAFMSLYGLFVPAVSGLEAVLDSAGGYK